MSALVIVGGSGCPDLSGQVIQKNLRRKGRDRDRVSGNVNSIPRSSGGVCQGSGDSSRLIAHVAREIGVREITLGSWVEAYRGKHAGQDPP